MRLCTLILSLLFFTSSTTYAAQDPVEHLQGELLRDDFVKPEIILTAEEAIFNLEISDLLKQSPYGAKLLRAATKIGYQFGGFLPTESDAITIPELRIIKISQNYPLTKAALQLAYELVNVQNSSRYCDIIQKARQGKVLCEEYAQHMIRLEAEAVYGRSMVAKELELSHLDSYYGFVSGIDESLPLEQKIEYIAKEMMISGKVVVPGGEEYVKNYYMQQCSSIIKKAVSG